MTAAARRQPMAWVPWAFVAAFAVVIAVNAVLVVMATRTFSGLVVEKPYLKGIAYERTLEREAAQAKLGWQVTTAFRQGALSVRYMGPEGQPVTTLSVTAEVRSPVGLETPISVELSYRGEGWYAAHIQLPRAGQWEAAARAQQGAELLHEQRFRFMSP